MVEEIFGPVFLYTELHEIAAAKLAQEGYENADLRNCITAWGKNLYTKKAEYRKIFDGISALKIFEENNNAISGKN